MPLHKVINFNSKTTVLIWKISESLDELLTQGGLTSRSIQRMEGMKSEAHQRGFLSVRKLLHEIGCSDADLYYDEFGKPNLKDGRNISISHSHEFSAIIVSDVNVGIDLELRRDKVLLIADRYNDNAHIDKSNKQDYISKLTVIWGVKESVFKIRNEPGISFINHIIVAPFEMSDRKTTARLIFEDVQQDFDIFFEEIENYSLIYAFEQ